MPEQYTQEKFENDLKELGLLVENQQKGGKPKKSSRKLVKKSAKKVVKKSAKKSVKKGGKSNKNNQNGGASKKKSLKKRVVLKKKKTVLKKKPSLKKKSSLKKRGGSKNNNNNNKNNNKNNNNQNGGKKNGDSKLRHFKVCKLNGKEVDFGSAEIKPSRTPLSAAKKLLKSIAHHMGLFKNNKAKLTATFEIRETTRGHAKVYGPYQGKYHKYSANELKEAATKGGKVRFSMKPVVKKLKNKSNHKGGR